MNAPAFRRELSAAQKTGRKAWREPIAGIKDQVMTCTTHSSRRTRAASWRGAALAWAAALSMAACQTHPAPEVHGEPRQAPPNSSGAEARPAAASAPVEPARVQAAKYDEGSYEGNAEGAHAAGAAAAHARGEATPAATLAGTETPLAETAGAAPGGGAKPTQGAVVSEEPFSAWLQAQSPVVAGGAAQVEAVLVAKAPYHCNAEYPHKFKLNAPPAGLTYPAEVVKGMVVTPERGVLRIPVKAQSAGPATVSGTLSFSVCTDERCLVEKRDLTLNLVVN